MVVLTPAVLLELVSALGPMGFVFWIFHRTTTVTIPRLAKQFEDAVEQSRKDYQALRNNEIDAFNRALQLAQDEKRLLLEHLLRLDTKARGDEP